MEKDMNIEEIKSKCLDSEGYLMFAAYLTSRKDKEGRAMIDFQYRRFHFSLEDARSSLASLRAFIDEEIKTLIIEGSAHDHPAPPEHEGPAD